MSPEHCDEEGVEPAGFSAQRILGEFGTRANGPVLIVVGGIHGNEPSGVRALQRIFAELEENKPEMHGRILGLAGNRLALERGVRFVDQDLNRIWGQSDIRSGSHEARERNELLEILIRESESDHRVVTLDLHATSADGAPFCIIANTEQNRELAFAFPTPVILGLEENVPGTLLGWASEQGHTALCFEGGQRSRPESIDHHEALIWLTLVEIGILRASDVPGLDSHRRRLTEACQRLPGVLEVIHRHEIEPGDGFAMDPGFINFEKVTQGQRLAGAGAEQEVSAPAGGRILMPLYQSQGTDGFFLVRPVLEV